MNDNMKLWDSVCETDPKTTKHINQRGGFTAIDAYSQIQKATEIFGPVGVGWGWHIEDVKELGGMAVVDLHFWHGTKDMTGGFGVIGQAALMQGKRGDQYPDNDCFKKAVTDAITKGLSYLGFNADVFLGKFDDNKYVAEMRAKFANEKPPADKPQDPQAVTEDQLRNLKGAWAQWTPEITQDTPFDEKLAKFVNWAQVQTLTTSDFSKVDNWTPELLEVCKKAIA